MKKGQELKSWADQLPNFLQPGTEIDIRRTHELYDRPVNGRSQDLFSQLLFSYKLNPQSVFYLGTSDAFEATGASGLHRGHRTYFLKIGYAWLR